MAQHAPRLLYFNKLELETGWTLMPLMPPCELQLCVQVLPGRRVLIVNHEDITRGRYAGEERNMLISNCLFRLGGAAVLLSNRCVFTP